MGWLQQIITAGTVIIYGTGPDIGLFVYNGTPKLGNPPIFQVVPPGVTKDPFGNTVAALVNIGNLSSAHAGWDSNGVEYLADSTATPRIVLDPGKSLVEILPSGGLGTQPVLTVGPNSGNDDFGATNLLAGFAAYISGLSLSNAIQVTGNTILWYTGPVGNTGPWTATTGIDNSGPGNGLSLGQGITGSGTRFVDPVSGITAIELGTTATPETWHTITLDAGWSNAGAFTPRYKALTDANIVIVQAVLSHAAITAATNINATNPLLAAYRPAHSQDIASPLYPGRCGALIGTNGVLTAEPLGTSVTTVNISGVYALD